MIRKYKLKSGNILEVFPDSLSESPNAWENDDIFLVYDHKQFNIPVNDFEPVNIYQHLRAKFELEKLPKDNLTIDQQDTKAIAEDHINTIYDEFFIYIVYAYIHSGISLSLGNNTYPFNDKWDVSSTGFVLVDKTEFGNDEKKAKEAAESLIKTWNQYLSGDVYGFKLLKLIESYKIKEDKLNQLETIKYIDENLYILKTEFIKNSEYLVEYEEIDSCYGFYGEDIKENGIKEHINDEIIEEIK